MVIRRNNGRFSQTWKEVDPDFPIKRVLVEFFAKNQNKENISIASSINQTVGHTLWLGISYTFFSSTAEMTNRLL